jgi:hypothetical protein
MYDDVTDSYAGTLFTSAYLWVRNMSAELDTNELYQKRDLSERSEDSGGGPNYLIGSTGLCYDCHAGNPAGNFPSDGDWSPVPEPQDIAFGGNGTDGDDRGTPASIGGIVGYYELVDGSEPDTTNVAPDLPSVLATAIPGGHFVKSMMGQGGTTDNYAVIGPSPASKHLYNISVGDKIPCSLCHDPHAGYDKTGSAGFGDDEVFFRREILAGEGQLAQRTDSYFDDLRASSLSRNGTGNGRAMCIYCHGTADWDHLSNPITGYAPLIVIDGATKYSIYGIRINTTGLNNPVDGSSNAFPPPDGPSEHESTDNLTECTSCHDHNNINAACGGCHEFPPTSGAHDAHADTTDGKPGFNCETCHGPNTGSASWHNQTGTSTYNENNSSHYNNITFSFNLTPAQRGTTEDNYYNQTWDNGSAMAITVTRGAGYNFTCVNAACHGRDPVNWNWTQGAGPNNPAPQEQYRLCGGCHGATSDIDGDGSVDPDADGDGDIDVASFYSRSGTLYQASNTAANYEGPVSGWAQGGHGDSTITDPTWFEDSAPNSEVPVACVACHDSSAGHFTLDNANPYRLNGAPYGGDDINQTGITNLCTQTDCHPKTTVAPDGYSYLEGVKHPNDFFDHPIDGPKSILAYDAGMRVHDENPGATTSNPAYDPIRLSGAETVGLHIDRYVDHWGWWGSSCTTATDDDDPFLPLDDSTTKNVGGSYNNNTSQIITCITCHNPHGSDLMVSGQSCGSASSLVLIPANKMLRLRDQDDEICEACHN